MKSNSIFDVNNDARCYSPNLNKRRTRLLNNGDKITISTATAIKLTNHRRLKLLTSSKSQNTVSQIFIT